MPNVAWDIWREVTTPSPPNEHPYHTLTIAAAHILLGACAAALVSQVMPQPAAPVLLIMAVYWFAKERRDLRLGASRLDCVIDLAMVGFGALYSGPLWWPLAGLLGAAVSPFIMRLR